MKKLINLTQYNLKLVLRDTGPMLMAFLMPIGFYILFGYMLQDVEIGSTSMGEILIPLYIIIIIGNAVLNVFGVYYVNAKETGNIQKYKFLGISEISYASSLFLATFFLQIIVIGLFILFTYFYAGYSFPIENILPILITLIIIEIYQFSLTYLLTSLFHKTSIYTSVALAIYMFQMFLGGLTFPLEMFPEFLQKAVYYVNPIIYGRNALLGAWTNIIPTTSILKDNLILLSVSVVFVVIGIFITKANQRSKTTTILSVK